MCIIFIEPNVRNDLAFSKYAWEHSYPIIVVYKHKASFSIRE